MLAANIGTSMLENRDTRDSQEDVQALGQIIVECLEPSTFLKEGKSLLKDWHSHVSNFVESTKSDSAKKLMKVWSLNSMKFPGLIFI